MNSNVLFFHHKKNCLRLFKIGKIRKYSKKFPQRHLTFFLFPDFFYVDFILIYFWRENLNKL